MVKNKVAPFYGHGVVHEYAKAHVFTALLSVCLPNLLHSYMIKVHSKFNK